ncbi:hypothetical protein [Bradyrhizobium sp. SYSU BS000235]|uniref:hypothetical protein n=1 Tax=Bradyrhizobium sp. SYSU BS000235 TaxID=3411332 RepID=UPI003C7523F7
MSMHSEPWPSDNKDIIEQIERELDAFEQAELAFRAQERSEREEKIKLLLSGYTAPAEPGAEQLTPPPHH